MRGVSFNWKDTDLKSFGLIAQEVELILPELVCTNSNNEKSIMYDNIIGILIEAIKELNDKIEAM